MGMQGIVDELDGLGIPSVKGEAFNENIEVTDSVF